MNRFVRRALTAALRPQPLKSLRGLSNGRTPGPDPGSGGSTPSPAASPDPGLPHDTELIPPGAVKYTPRQRQIIDIGWEVAKAYGTHVYHQQNAVPPVLHLWLAADGWQAGSTIFLERHDAGTMALSVKTWEALGLASPYNPN